MTRMFNSQPTPTSPITRRGFFFLASACGVSGSPLLRAAGIDLPHAKPVPRFQALPLPHDQVSFTRDGAELTRYHHGPNLRRPYLYPVVGPSGRSLTRMGHPHDPVGHSHHNSVWIAHHDVNGVSFWADTGEGRIVHQRIQKFLDADDVAWLVSFNHWQGKDGQPVLIEKRAMGLIGLERDDYLIVLDTQLEAPPGRPATFGKTPFGLVGVRMAKTIGVNDGGGLIRNSQGNVNEQGDNGCFWKKARWVDYSGPIAPDAREGIALLDHPDNPNHPATFHVRADGWMGACLSFEGPITVEPGRPLRVRYGLHVHRDAASASHIDAAWKRLSQMTVLDLSAK
jgi:hypothetical protein